MNLEPFRGRLLYKVEDFTVEGYFGPLLRRRDVLTKDISQASVVSSEVGGGLHKPAVDIDHRCFLIPSSTPGHFHLYIDVEMSWRKYKRLLRALVACGVVEPGYYKVSRRRGGTHLRLPWVKK